MTTYGTNNPLGSQDPRDLYDNAQNFDHLSNDQVNESWNDRFGNPRQTWHGIETMAQAAMSAYGYVILTGKTFTTGATINNPNEVLLNTADGEYYKWTGSFAGGSKVVPANSTPASTGGIGPGAWLGVGDASMRAALAALSGAGLVGFDSAQNYAANTVGGELKFIESEISDLKNNLPYAIRTLPTVLKKANDGATITIACYGAIALGSLVTIAGTSTT